MHSDLTKKNFLKRPSPDAPRRGVREESTVQQHRPADQVQSEEHGQGKDEIDGHVRCRSGRSIIVDDLPTEDETPWNRMDGADEQLQTELGYRLRGDGDAPILDAVVDDEQLKITSVKRTQHFALLLESIKQTKYKFRLRIL